MTMRYTTIFCLILSGIIFASAQVFSFDKEKLPASIIVQAGVNSSDFTVDHWVGFPADLNFNHDFGFSFGMSVDIPIAKSFYLQPGLCWTKKSAKLQIYDGGGIQSFTFRPFFVEAPLLVSLRLNYSRLFQLHVNIGPYIALGATGTVQGIDLFHPTYNKGTNMLGQTVWLGAPTTPATLHRFDMGLSVGLGVQIWRFRIGLKYDYGLVNLANYDNLPIGNNQELETLANKYGVKSIHSRSLSFNVGYRLSLPRFLHRKGLRSVRQNQEDKTKAF